LRQAKVFEDALAADEKMVADIDARLKKSADALEHAVDAMIARS